MQVFLPYISFIETAKCLDYKRLGKQRVEAMQILRILTGVTPQSKWRHHPCVKQWKGYEETLKVYHDTMIQEWIDRGYKNTMIKFNQSEQIAYELPPWLDDNFCSRHRSTLLAKDFEYYKKFNWEEQPKIDYIWGDNV